jgi:hypothetical protein
MFFLHIEIINNYKKLHIEIKSIIEIIYTKKLHIEIKHIIGLTHILFLHIEKKINYNF